MNSKNAFTKVEAAKAISAAFWGWLVVTTLLVLAFFFGPLTLASITPQAIVWGVGLACYWMLLIMCMWRYQQRVLSFLIPLPAFIGMGLDYSYMLFDSFIIGFWSCLLMLIVFKKPLLKGLSD